jgi:hypothetical protein
MSLARRRSLRLLWTLCILVVANNPSLGGAADVVLPTESVSMESTAAVPEQLSMRFPPEVRIRKLHLVRPDLIPYPIAYEVVC